jgi:hypothetical protein
VTTTAAAVTRARDDELVRDARARAVNGRLEHRAQAVLALWCPLVLAACVGAVFLDGGPAFSWWTTAFFVLLYAGVSRVEFEIGTGSAVPTQLVLVPMLFALPIGTVPLVAAAGLVVRTVGDRP